MKLETFILRAGLNKYFPNGNKEELIAIFDTSIGSFNIGDEIINLSALKVLKEIFNKKQFIRLPTHVGVSSTGIDRANLAAHRIVVGSNLLSGHMFRSGQWNLSPLDVVRIKSQIMMGVGWQSYQGYVSSTTKLAYKSLFSKEGYHSVRDEFTKKKLEELGIKNVINTGCPTMWKLTEQHCAEIPNNKARNVVFTLTDRRRDIEMDKYLIETLIENYEDIYFWRQGLDDLDYFKTLGNFDNIKVISPFVSDYDEILSSNEDLDFVGTRLHAGIRALQHKRRSIIIAVDNRATEISKDSNVKIIQREKIKQDLKSTINSNFKTEIRLNNEGINLWISQF